MLKQENGMVELETSKATITDLRMWSYSNI